MTDIYGLPTDNGQAVVYHDAQGRLVEGVIRNLWPPLYRADLEVKYFDGTTRFVEGASFNDGPGPGGWKHVQGEATAASSQASEGEATAASSSDPGDQAPASKKKGSK